MKKKAVFIFFLLLFLLCPKFVFAQDNEKVITIVNPVRISKYNQQPGESLKAEYQVVKEQNLPATWLLTYDALKNSEIENEIAQMDKNQEFGVFLEITAQFASDSEVVYHDTGSWHHATNVFLSGYSQDERKKLIDNIFEMFKEKFGNYPKSVGSWWTDAFSLSYMKEKYGVAVNLVCADQFSTDNYQIWGQPWQTAYFPSKFHPAIPADTDEDKLDVVNIQWASRDPLKGYESSLFSTQDYKLTEEKLDTDYFENLINTYLKSDNKLNQVVVGLEADLSPGGYGGEYKNQIEVVSNHQKKGVKIMTMSDFAELFIQDFPNGNEETKYQSEETCWYNSPNYRIFYVRNLESDRLEIKDLRVYNNQMIDPYFFSPNKEFNLNIDIPFVIDTVQIPENSWVLSKNTEIKTEKERILIKGSSLKIPNFVKENPFLNIKKSKDGVEITFRNLDFDNNQGDIIKGLSSEAKHFFNTKSFFLKLLTGKGWNNFTKIEYLVPKEEIYALMFLKSLPNGKVMVADRECLQCSWGTDNKPIFIANIRKYVKNYSGKKIVYNRSVFDAETREEAQKEFNKLKVKYVYLVKFEGYSEKLPFSPGDLNVEKVFSNANAEIWKVK